MTDLQLWGGVECTVNRVGDDYFDQLERNGHANREDDIERFASLGIRALRYPLLWERIAPDGSERADWRWADARMALLRRWRIDPIVGLVHHGSGPRHTSLLDPQFPARLAEYAGAVARRYPWVSHYTPVNEPLTTARFSALYGVWYPHARADRDFVAALLNQAVATVQAMQAVRRVNPGALLVQTEDLGKAHGTAPLQEVVDFYNERRWLSWDLLCGRVGPGHALWDYLQAHGADRGQLAWLQEHPCPPDLLGPNYYVTGERWLDHRLDRYPARYHGEAFGHALVDIECPRARAAPPIDIGPLLLEAWQRYGIPIAVTEAHIDARREDQLRWLHEIWRASGWARRQGADVRAVTVWALLGSFDWHCLVTRCEGRYEPGPFDLHGAEPRPTALAALMRELAAGVAPTHPVVAAPGWWRRPGRHFCSVDPEPGDAATTPAGVQAAAADLRAPPLAVVGDGPLARALRQCCEGRHIAVHPLPAGATPQALQAVPGSPPAVLRPWAVVHADGVPPDADAWAAWCAGLGIHHTCIGAPPARDGVAALQVEPPDTAVASDGELQDLLDHVLDLVVDRQAGHLSGRRSHFMLRTPGMAEPALSASR